ncbi:MAG: hypothetical protein RL685_1835 [Pseudomonadota bacterium]|jgi:hypothetical protein
MQLLGVSPARIPLGRETMLTVTGKHLRPSLRIDLDSKEPARVGELVAWVGGVGPLDATAVAGTDELHIVAPAQLRLGRYAVVLEDTLAGRRAQLTDAVEVFEPQNGDTDVDAAAPDGGTAAAPDGGTAGERDAGTTTGLVDAAAPPCAGVPHGDVCWYLGEAGTTCDQTCTGHGGYDAEASRLIGTTAQGGSAAQCAAILLLLGYDQAPAEASRPDVGLGCHVWGVEQRTYWLTEPEFAPSAESSEARVVCGCES